MECFFRLSLQIIFGLLFSLSAFAIGVNPKDHWRTFETDHFKFHYMHDRVDEALWLSEVAEKEIYIPITNAFRWWPKEKTQVVMSDFTDFSNGFAKPLPFNLTGIYLSPPTAGELVTNESWLKMLFLHEFVHVVHLDKAANIPKDLRKIFGRQFFFFPNLLQPNWILEGLATWMESQNPRSGRLLNSAYEAKMKKEVDNGLKPLSVLNANGRLLPENKSYLYGAYFFEFLETVYGRDRVFQFVENYSDNIVPYRVYSNPVGAIGKNMSLLWQEYQVWLQKRFAGKERFVGKERLDAKRLVDDDQTILSVLDASRVGDTFYYVSVDGYTRPKLVRKTLLGKKTVLGVVRSGARVRAINDEQVLVIQPEICKNRNQFYDLYRFDGKKKTRLTRCGRYRDAQTLFFKEKQLGFIAAHFDRGQFFIVQLDNNGNKIKTVFTFPLYQRLTGLAVDLHGEWVYATVQVGRDFQLKKIQRTTGKEQVLLADAAVKYSPQFSSHHNAVDFVSDDDFHFRLWRYDLATGQKQLLIQNDLSIASLAGSDENSAMVLALSPDSSRDQDLYHFSISPMAHKIPPRRGELPQAPEKIQQASDKTQQAPKKIEIPSSRPYQPWRSMAPTGWLPSLIVADGMRQVGVSVFGQDALGVHRYMMMPQVEQTQEKMTGVLSYQYDQRHFIQLSREMDVLNTRFDQNQQEITRYDLSHQVDWVSTFPWLQWDQSLIFALGAQANYKKRIWVEGDTSVRTDEKVMGGYVMYDRTQSQRFSEGVSEGGKASLLFESYDPFQSSFSGHNVRIDGSYFFSMAKSVWALDLLWARADETAEPFELGDVVQVKTLFFNQRDFPLRGYDDGHPKLIGHRLNKGTLEWRIPVWDVDYHAMRIPIGLNRISVHWFYEGGSAYNSGEDNRYYTSTGLEWHLELKLLYALSVPVRIGYAQGLDDLLGKKKSYITLGFVF